MTPTEKLQPAGPARQPACRHLLSKGMYVTGTLDPEVDSGIMGDGYCWCAMTQRQLGPDNAFVERATCIPGRSCYLER
jgi:hypothetical protein